VLGSKLERSGGRTRTNEGIVPGDENEGKLHSIFEGTGDRLRCLEAATYANIETRNGQNTRRTHRLNIEIQDSGFRSGAGRVWEIIKGNKTRTNQVCDEADQQLSRRKTAGQLRSKRESIGNKHARHSERE